jgi:hypothetical protein
MRQQRRQIEFAGNGAGALDHALAGFKIVGARGMDRRRQPAGVGFRRAFAEAPRPLQEVGQRLQCAVELAGKHQCFDIGDECERPRDLGFGSLVERDGFLQQRNPFPDLPETSHRPAKASHDP